MRIAHALQMPALQQGGVEVLVRTLIADTPTGDEIFLISQDKDSELTGAGWESRLAGHFAVPAETLPNCWHRALVSWVRVHKIDLCHFHLSGTYGWKARSWSHCPITNLARIGIPVVCTNHQAVTFFDQGRPPEPTWRKYACTLGFWPAKARQLASVHWEASVSKHDLKLSRQCFPGFDSKLIQIYHSRLDAERPVSPPISSKTILNVATVAFRKGPHLLVDAFARIASDFPEWKLDLVGYLAEQECVDQIHKIIRDNQLEGRVLLHGPNPDPTKFFEVAEIYVQPSLLEGLGLSLQEAMFHGRACIGTATGGIPELIADPSLGVLFPSGDVTALSQCLARLMSDPAERRHLGSNARASILTRGMTRQAMTSTYRSLYQQVLQPGSGL